ncbi:FIST signal transduction protein [Clostridium sp. JS66]|uniref:FIST signal transduction protein n=1 Tax=Clostridium sp. JS66 TaxID=3064705 RepID=UPI00298E7353|nr:FIST N-terminal domain-containing protein [Clostridium sp. JS66]WPC39394.1 FIST N-terminal domain-containing protein [Clostridium sp. JS66]
MESVNFVNVEETINYIGTKNEKAFVIFTDVEKVKKLSSACLNNVVLCSTSGEYTNEGYKNGAITGFEYDANEGEIIEIAYPPIISLEKLKEGYRKVKDNKDAFALLLCDGLSGMEETILTTFYFMEDSFKIIGGSAGDNLKFSETLIYIGNRRVYSAILFFNSKHKTYLIKENIYAPTKNKLLITEADIISRTVKTFNNKPAATEYARVLGIKESELSKFFMNNPLGKIYREDIYIASPMKVNNDKSITFYSQLIPNTFVQVLKAVDPIEQVRKTTSKLPFKPSFAIVINCILRSLKFQQEGIWKDIDREILKACSNTTGFVSYGEQFYKMHSNQTMVMLLVQ